MRAILDTDVVIRLLTGDDRQKQARAEALMDSAARGEVELVLNTTTVADAVFVLSSRRLYALPRSDTAELLRSFLALPGISCEHLGLVLSALHLFAQFAVDFGDAYIAASAIYQELPVYSFDRDYDRIPDVQRMEP